LSAARPFYRSHIFCCVNKRADGHPRGCCENGGASKLRGHLKARVKLLGLKHVRVNAAQCLDRCELGPTMVIYPEGVWYTYRTTRDLDEILERHILKGEQVERLLLHPAQSEPDEARINGPTGRAAE
jgi:(2Fe-2S) ferredoxin